VLITAKRGPVGRDNDDDDAYANNTSTSEITATAVTTVTFISLFQEDPFF
jgi:hypothetical protein